MLNLLTVLKINAVLAIYPLLYYSPNTVKSFILVQTHQKILILDLNLESNYIK